VRIDGVKKESGDMTEDWDFLEPKTIKVGSSHTQTEGERGSATERWTTEW
jgi:hypothetical protein